MTRFASCSIQRVSSTLHKKITKKPMILRHRSWYPLQESASGAFFVQLENNRKKYFKTPPPLPPPDMCSHGPELGPCPICSLPSAAGSSSTCLGKVLKRHELHTYCNLVYIDNKKCVALGRSESGEVFLLKKSAQRPFFPNLPGLPYTAVLPADFPEKPVMLWNARYVIYRASQHEYHGELAQIEHHLQQILKHNVIRKEEHKYVYRFGSYAEDDLLPYLDDSPPLLDDTSIDRFIPISSI